MCRQRSDVIRRPRGLHPTDWDRAGVDLSGLGVANGGEEGRHV